MYESRFHLRHESEASLLGVVYDDRGIMTAAPYHVIDAEPLGLRRHRPARRRSLRRGILHERIPGGASGHETDKISKSSPAGTRCSPKARTRTTAARRWSIVEPAGGGAVFSAGSITWVSSLLVDDAVSQITRNVLTRFLNDK